ncbi:MAG: Trm112 family protein [Candidatus Nanopelagicales bacterium]
MSSTLGLDPLLLELLRCPQPHHAELRVDEDRHELVCTECGAAYPVRDGLPIMLIDEARQGSG